MHQEEDVYPKNHASKVGLFLTFLNLDYCYRLRRSGLCKMRLLQPPSGNN